MSSRRFKKERHPFAYHPPPKDPSASTIGNNTTTGNDEDPSDHRTLAESGKDGSNSPPHWGTMWCPSIRTGVHLMLCARLCSMVWSHITDCDETFNYWEPLHYILHKRGFQTWEYSPTYAIRSYAYILLHALPLRLYEFLANPNRIFTFYFLRLIFVMASVAVEGCLYNAVTKKFGPSVARIFLTFQIFSPGLFISATAFLPSSFTMLMTTGAFAAWFLGRDIVAITAIAISAILGWPFAGILGIPIAVDVIRRKGLLFFVRVVAGIGGVISGAVITVDSIYYGKLVFPPLNIVLYNVISGHGPELYGIAPWYFYVLNGFLNFNLVFFLGLFCPVLIGIFYLLCRKQLHTLWDQQAWNFAIGCAVSVGIWLVIFFGTPHKEERFLFPVYSLITVLAAIATELLLKFCSLGITKLPYLRNSSQVLHGITWLILGIFITLSLSRMFALSKFYTAPLDVYMRLQQETDTVKAAKYPVNLCVGKEWYRFPSSFFLPDQWELRFLQSEFKGLLPKPYGPYPSGFRVIPTEMNDENREEASRYVDVCDCSYIVDFDVDGSESVLEPRYAKLAEWHTVYREPFLDASASHRFLRAFYVPWFSEKYCRFGEYVLLRRTKQCERKPDKRVKL